MRARPAGFMANEVRSYVDELHGYLWAFVRAVRVHAPPADASGHLRDFVDSALREAQAQGLAALALRDVESAQERRRDVESRLCGVEDLEQRVAALEGLEADAAYKVAAARIDAYKVAAGAQSRRDCRRDLCTVVCRRPLDLCAACGHARWRHSAAGDYCFVKFGNPVERCSCTEFVA